MNDIANEVMAKRFRTTRLRRGYDADAVDDYLDLVALGDIPACDLRAKRFDAVRFREGYNIAQVDAFLGHIADELDS